MADCLIQAVNEVCDAVRDDVSASATLATRTAVEAAALKIVHHLNLDGITPLEAARRAAIITLSVAVPVSLGRRGPE